MKKIIGILLGSFLLVCVPSAARDRGPYRVSTDTGDLLEGLASAPQAQAWQKRIQEIDGSVRITSFSLFKQAVIPFLDRGGFTLPELRKRGRTQLLCYSSDGQKAVDMFGGMELARKGKRWTAGFSVDRSFQLYDFKTMTGYHLMTLGPMHAFDDGFWLDAGCFAALGRWRLQPDSNVTPAVFVFFLAEHRYKVFTGPELNGSLFRKKWNGLKFLSQKFPAIDFQ